MGITGRTVGSSDVVLDSSVLQWKLDEGSGTSTSDSIGTNGGTTNGSWTLDDDFIGDYVLSPDGTDDDIESDEDPDAIARNRDHSVALTVHVESVTEGAI